MGQMKKALITGPFGQDGSYLCELLSGYGYEVHGIARKSLSENSEKIKLKVSLLQKMLSQLFIIVI